MVHTYIQIDRSCDLEASRELLTYSLLHPVFTDEEKAQFNIWRQYLNPILPLNRGRIYFPLI